MYIVCIFIFVNINNLQRPPGLIRHLLTVNPKKRAKMSDIVTHWWVNLGFRETPTNQPYPVPEVLKPVTLRSVYLILYLTGGGGGSTWVSERPQPTSPTPSQRCSNPSLSGQCTLYLTGGGGNLGFRETPTNQPYPVPEVLKPVTLRSVYLISRGGGDILLLRICKIKIHCLSREILQHFFKISCLMNKSLVKIHIKYRYMGKVEFMELQ